MNFRIKNRHRLKNKDIKEIQEELQKQFNENFFDTKATFETGDYNNVNIIFIDQEPCFMYHENKIFFTLKGLTKYKPKNNYVVVDMGAVKFVTSGADVMSPGIIDADMMINEGDQVWICDEKNHKPLAVGVALISGEKMVEDKKGKAINVIHYVTDELWKFVAKSL